jgi:hypothetical protein
MAMHATADRPSSDLRRVALAAAAVTLVAAWWSSSQGLELLYADTRSHLTIARRLIDGPNTGLVQLGTVWLPLQHLVLAPLSAIDWLWTSGWGAALLGSACMAASAAALWHIATVLSRGARIAGLVAVVLYVTNPAILYMHTTAFTEPVLYASVLVATSGLVHWANRAKPFSGGEMALYCGGPAALAVLARYDGWAYVAVWAVCVGAMSLRRWGSARHAGKMVAAFAAPPALAASWWMWFNWRNFGDPLEFQRGRYSAQAQQDLLARQGLLPDEGDLGRSVETFVRAAGSAAGWIALVAAAAGVVVLVLRWRREQGTGSALPRTFALVLVLTGTPVVFYVWSLFAGQVALRFGDAVGESIFNLRYGAAVIPGLAILASVALAELGGEVRWRQGVAAALSIAPFVALAVVPGWRDVGVIEEGLAQREAGRDEWAAAEWLHDRLDGGTLLIDDSISPMLPVIGADLDQVVAPFSEGWESALADPSGTTLIFVDRDAPDDEVRRTIAEDPRFLDGFDLVAEFGSVAVYQNQEAGS